MKINILRSSFRMTLFAVFNFLFLQINVAQNYKHLDQELEISIKSIPSGLPDKLAIPIQYSGETLTMVLKKVNVFGKNTKFLIDDGTGKLIETPIDQERSYLGTINEHMDYNVSAVLTDRGLIASIYRPHQPVLEIVPSQGTNNIYKIKEITEYSCVYNPKVLKNTEGALQIDTKETNNSSVTSEKSRLTKNITAKTTLRPTTVMDILEFEIGVEIGSRSFFSSTAYNGNLATAQASAQSIIGNLNSRFLHSTGVRFRLGTVIIRTNVNTDPLRNLVTATGASSNASSSLGAFRDFWNNNPGEVGNSHDIAVYHVASAPSGLAYVNSIGSRNRYATMGGNGATSWANGTAAHELGHSFGLRHVNNSGFFYEARPRNNNGTNSSGGDNNFISIMDGRGRHNIGRMSTSEAKKVTETKNQKRSFGDLITNGPNIRPFGVFDETEISTSQPFILIDVIANDYDANNNVLDVRMLDGISSQGGQISLSQGTGPGGRNQIRYTPPPSGISNRDFFHYTVFDTVGGTDFGAVYVTQVPGVDPNARELLFDFGTSNSPLFNNAIRVTNTTQNSDFGWTDTARLNATDRGGSSSVDALNRDFVWSSQARTFEVNVSNGEWEVLLTFGDRNFAHDNMAVKAEGMFKVTNFSTNAGQFLNQKFEVEIRDGKVSLEFSDQGGRDVNWVITRLRLKKLRDAANTIAIGSEISLKGNNGNYVSSENGTKPINCNRNSIRDWERFTVVDAGEGKIALRGNNGKYVSSENGNSPMNCNRSRIGAWEKFTWGINQGKITLRGNNNLYVSSEDGRSPMNCNRENIGRFERFDVETIRTRSFDDDITSKSMAYPNPTTGILNIDQVSIGDIVIIMDHLGREIQKTIVKSTIEQIDLSGLQGSLYFVKINSELPIKVLKR